MIYCVIEFIADSDINQIFNLIYGFIQKEYF